MGDDEAHQGGDASEGLPGGERDSTPESASAAPPSRRADHDRLLTLYYDDLRRIARRILHGDGGALLLRPTELTHEAAMRLMKLERMSWTDVTHFLATAARLMRQVLLDEVRRARAAKRQAPPALTLWPAAGSDGAPEGEADPVDIEALDASLTRLSEISPERAAVVELRFYAGLTIEEIAKVCGVSDTQVKRRWRAARAWLLEDLARS